VRGMPGRKTGMHLVPGEGEVLGKITSGASARCLLLSNLTDNAEGNKYFLLLVDDLSKYMWVAVIPSKDM
jgi:hypothetical protein